MACRLLHIPMMKQLITFPISEQFSGNENQNQVSGRRNKQADNFIGRPTKIDVEGKEIEEINYEGTEIEKR